MGEDFVFEDTDEEAPIWTFEDRLAGDASQRAVSAAPAAEPRGVLDPQMADVLSAYSSEQGAGFAVNRWSRFTDLQMVSLARALPTSE